MCLLLPGTVLASRDVSALSVELMLDLKIETVLNKKDLLDEDTVTSAFTI